MRSLPSFSSQPDLYYSTVSPVMAVLDICSLRIASSAHVWNGDMFPVPVQSVKNCRNITNAVLYSA